MKQIRQLAVLGLIAVMGMTGCATISGGTQETVTIHSVPAGAMVTIDGGVQYTTPASVSLRRKKDHLLTVEKAGYKKATIQLDREFRGWPTIGGNILWLLPGVIVDASTGAMYEFKDKSVQVTLEPEVPVAASDPAKAGNEARPSMPPPATPTRSGVKQDTQQAPD